MDYFHLFLGSGLLILGLVSAFYTLKFIFTPLRKIVLADGNSTIKGVVSPEISIFSPITKAPCVYCVYRTFQRGAKMARKPRGIAQVVAGSGVVKSSFFLEDDTGKILVQMDKASMFGTPHKVSVSDDTKEYTDSVREFKANMKIGEGENREYEEDLVIPGDSIYINGNVKIENGQKIIHADLLSFKSAKRTGLHPMGIILVLALIIFGIRFILQAL